MAGARGTYGGEVGLLGYTERHVDLGLAVLLIAALLLVAMGVLGLFGTRMRTLD